VLSQYFGPFPLSVLEQTSKAREHINTKFSISIPIFIFVNQPLNENDPFSKLHKNKFTTYNLQLTLQFRIFKTGSPAIIARIN